MRCLLGIDIGTQATKAALYAENGGCLAEALRPAQPHRPSPGVVEEDPEWQLRSVCETARECLEKSRISATDVLGLAVAGQMAGVIGVGPDGRAVTPYDSWLDARCGPYIIRMQAEAGDEILALTGNAPSFNHGPKKLWWKTERPDDYRRIHAFVQPGGYAIMRLCGLGADQAFIDKTYLHFSGFADNRRLQWSESICRRFDFDPAKLPRIVEPGRVMGQLTAPMAAQCGLRVATPVVAGCGDTAASFLSCGATREGICVDVAGTASVFAATTREFLADTKSHVLGCGHSATPGLWHPYAYINGGGQNLEWFRREILSERLSYDELNAQAAERKDDLDLPMFIPHLGGRVCPGWPNLRGAWAGLGWETSPGQLYRAMLEGVALEYCLYQRALLALLPEFSVREIRITGGGEKSAVWNQLKADRLQTRVVGIARSGGAAMGAALLAGHGVGVFPDLSAAAASWVELGAAFTPDQTQARVSAERVRRYSRLLEALHSLAP